jgi:hypothetical protein
MHFRDNDTWYVDFVISITKNKRRGKNPQTWKVTYASETVVDVVDGSPEHANALELQQLALERSQSGTTVAYVAYRPRTEVANEVVE